MKKNFPAVPPELSRPLKIERVPMGGIEEHIVASPIEREALAKRFGLIDLPRFEAFLNVERAEGQMFAVTGRLSADVVQACVVSLDPVSDKVQDTIDVLFAPPHLIKDEHEGPLGDLGDAEPPEPITNGMVDLGELAAQHLAMALNPYPRKEGVEWAGLVVGSKEESQKPPTHKPFEVLAKLKKKTEETEN